MRTFLFSSQSSGESDFGNDLSNPDAVINDWLLRSMDFRLSESRLYSSSLWSLEQGNRDTCAYYLVWDGKIVIQESLDLEC